MLFATIVRSRKGVFQMFPYRAFTKCHRIGRLSHKSLLRSLVLMSKPQTCAATPSGPEPLRTKNGASSLPDGNDRHPDSVLRASLCCTPPSCASQGGIQCDSCCRGMGHALDLGTEWRSLFSSEPLQDLCRIYQLEPVLGEREDLKRGAAPLGAMQRQAGGPCRALLPPFFLQ